MRQHHSAVRFDKLFCSWSQFLAAASPEGPIADPFVWNFFHARWTKQSSAKLSQSSNAVHQDVLVAHSCENLGESTPKGPVSFFFFLLLDESHTPRQEGVRSSERGAQCNFSQGSFAQK